MFVIFAVALLRIVPMPNRVVALTPFDSLRGRSSPLVLRICELSMTDAISGLIL